MAQLCDATKNATKRATNRMTIGLGLVACIALAARPAAAQTTFTVNSPNDVVDGTCNAAHCSLREAINLANATTAHDLIVFAIGSGARTINVIASPIRITRPLTIDGTTQPGFAGTPLVELRGPGRGVFANNAPIHGLELSANSGGSEIVGLAITNFSGFGINVGSANNDIAGNFIGIDQTGNAIPNAGGGINLGASSSDNLIGSTDPLQGNVIAGNRSTNGQSADGILVASSGNTFINNRIGIGPDGKALANGGSGVNITGTGANHNTLGFGTGGFGNTIAFNDGAGVRINVGFANSVSGNSIFSNNGLGIDLVGTGANHGQATPVLQSAVRNWTFTPSPPSLHPTTRITGTLAGVKISGFHIDVYDNSTCTAAEGEHLIATGSADTDGTFDFKAPGFLQFVTLVARSPEDDTSEFSACVAATGVTFP